jgi:hypothetical protein
MRSSAGLASPILQAAPSLKYIANRQVEDAANGIVNREVGALLSMPRLAFERIIVHKPKEAAPRRGPAPCRPLHAGCGGTFYRSSSTYVVTPTQAWDRQLHRRDGILAQ